MANRRMISKTVLCADTFTELPARTRLLYVYLIMEADDDGLIGTTKNALFLSGAKALERPPPLTLTNFYTLKLCRIKHTVFVSKMLTICQSSLSQYQISIVKVRLV